MAPPASGSLLEITVEKCSPYSSSELTCNNELTLFVRVAVVLPLPTKPRALREPYFARNICKNRYTFALSFPLAQLWTSSHCAALKLPQIDVIYPFCKYFSFRLRMCIFFSTSMAPPASGSLLEITDEKCSPYSRYTRNICKIGYTFCNDCCIHNYEQALIVLQKSIADR